MYSIPCVIFAGGKSSRMGRDKALLKFGELPLAQYQYNRLKKIFSQVYISTKEDKFPFKAPLVLDSSAQFAPIFAFLDIFNKLDTFFAISVDSPFVDKTVIGTLLQNSSNTPATIAKTNQLHPLIGVYKKEFLPFVQEAISRKEYKLQEVLKAAKAKVVEFPNTHHFLNLNYPHQFEEAISIKEKL